MGRRGGVRGSGEEAVGIIAMKLREALDAQVAANYAYRAERINAFLGTDWATTAAAEAERA